MTIETMKAAFGGFGSALVVGMIVYFLFSLGMGIPLVIAAMAIAPALLLLRLEHAVPWIVVVGALVSALGIGAWLWRSRVLRLGHQSP